MSDYAHSTGGILVPTPTVEEKRVERQRDPNTGMEYCDCPDGECKGTILIYVCKACGL